jgi:SNF2 family DNA or RNA helicase
MNKLQINGTYIEIQCDRNDTASQELAMKIPYVHCNRIKTKYTTSTCNIDLVLKLFRGIDAHSVDKLPPVIRSIYDTEMKRRIAAKTLLELGPVGDRGFLYAHQQLGRELADIYNKYAFYYSTGTGKTPMSLQIVADDIAISPSHKWLVVCPLSLVKTAWTEDCAQFFPDLTIQPLHATTKPARLKLFNNKANIYVINFEGIDSYAEEIEKLGIYGLIIDEASKLKNPNSKTSKSLVEYCAKLKRVYLLSGTPSPNGLYEYYAQLRCLDIFNVPQSYSAFKKEFFTNVSFNPQYEVLQVKLDRKEELLNHIKKYAIYMAKEDCLDLPDKVFVDRKIELPPDIRKEYDKMRKDLYISLGEETDILAQSSVAMLNKLNQISSGFIIDTELQITHRLGTFKVKELQEVLEEIGDEQVVIWANFKEEYKMIKEALGDKCIEYHGGVGIDAKNAAVGKFKAGEVQYFLANPISAAHGLTLTNASYMIFYSYNYSLELYAQAVDRIHRIGQTNKCTYISMGE